MQLSKALVLLVMASIKVFMRRAQADSLWRYVVPTILLDLPQQVWV